MFQKRADKRFSERDVSDFSKEELLRYVDALEMEISGTCHYDTS